jgi:hypothetical protein
VNLLTNKNPNLQNNTNFNKNGQQKVSEEAVQQVQHLKQQIEQNTTVMVQYQQIIRDQDVKLRELYQVNQSLNQTCALLQERCTHLESIAQPSMNRESEPHLVSEKLKSQARINELELKVNQLEEK